ncbi:MAG: cell division protein ZapA [Desulfovibrionaceae bacterium]|nr:cell division protein ZapA [Desulfovibrionaceae bacterium]
MPRYTLTVLGHEISFKTDADGERIEAARALLEGRFKELSKGGANISKEKLLIFLVLSLADDYLESDARLRRMEERLAELLKSDPLGLDA